jgi:hypothetical protein
MGAEVPVQHEQNPAGENSDPGGHGADGIVPATLDAIPNLKFLNDLRDSLGVIDA